MITVQVGDRVVRMLAGRVPMPLIVTAVDEEFIYCGDWKFSRETGAEIDEDLGWTAHASGSMIQRRAKQ